MRKFPVLVVLLIIVALIAGCASSQKPTTTTSAPQTTTPAATINLVYASYGAEANALFGEIPNTFFKALADGTNGRVQTRSVYGGALLAQADMAQGVGKGVADFGNIYVGSTTELVMMNTLSGIYDPNIGSKIPTVGMLSIYNELIKQMPELKEEPEKLINCKYVVPEPSEAWLWIMTKPITSLDSLKGTRIRTVGKYLPQLATALGASPVSMAMTDVYVSLQTGVMEGAVSGTDGVRGQKWHEVAPYLFYPSPEGKPRPVPAPVTSWIIMNLDRYKGLPADVKQVFDKAMLDSYTWSPQRIGKIEDDAIALMLQQGGKEVNYLSEADFNKMLTLNLDWYKMAADDLNAKGGPGTKLLSLYTQLADEYIKTHK